MFVSYRVQTLKLVALSHAHCLYVSLISSGKAKIGCFVPCALFVLIALLGAIHIVPFPGPLGEMLVFFFRLAVERCSGVAGLLLFNCCRFLQCGS